jgi:hypothetical protein
MDNQTHKSQQTNHHLSYFKTLIYPCISKEMKIGRLLFSRSTMIFFGWTQGDHGQPCMYTVVSHTIDVKTPRSLVLKYKFELTRVGSQEEEQHIINKLLPLLTERISAPSQPSNRYVVFGRRLARQEQAKTR